MQDFDKLIPMECQLHPFVNIEKHIDYKNLLANYLAMLQAYPYLLTGSQYAVYLDYLQNNKEIPDHVELTSVVSNIMCWEQTLGFDLIIDQGFRALPNLLQTQRLQVQLFKKDCERLGYKNLAPDYSGSTMAYLKALYTGLSSPCAVTRSAYLLSMNDHAQIRDKALQNSLAEYYKVNKQTIIYFNLQVTAKEEQYQKQMLATLIANIIKDDKKLLFIEKFQQAYKLHYHWSSELTDKKIVALSQQLH